ncbi:Orange domain [Cinara cedri]|uniref:Orange domain n=1 Tax=Cinara cedri TaxID=506608 RepID=A0A5E4MGE0_9HEMI|nr:Orange domain [Cinara cedri]
MQDRLTTTCLLQEGPATNNKELKAVQEESGSALPVDIFQVAELVAGYMDCMEEALRYLQEVEEYPEEHPAVQGLRNHLDRSRQKLMDQALMLQA